MTNDDTGDLTDTAPGSERTRRVLRIAFWLNAGLSASLFATGILASSSGLLANALDNTSDAAVYAISYYAAVRGPAWKTPAARLSGVMLLVLAVGVLVDVARRSVVGTEPVSVVIMVMAVVAAIVNVVCLRLLHRSRRSDVNLRAAWTFSINDLLSNVGVLIAGVLVAWLERPWPDLVVGLAIALVAAKGGIGILRDVHHTKREQQAR